MKNCLLTLILVSMILQLALVVSAGTSSYSYDERGRPSSYAPPVPSGHPAITYTYNNLNEKTAITNHASWKTRYDAATALWSLNASCAADTLRLLVADECIPSDLRARMQALLGSDP